MQPEELNERKEGNSSLVAMFDDSIITVLLEVVSGEGFA
jgi:hypothetical protein